MLLDLKFSIGTLGLATGTLFSALYGMNLKNFIEESDAGFGAVSTICFALTAIVCVYGLAKLRKVQRVRMWGEAGVGGATPQNPLAGRHGAKLGSRANWRADSVEPIWGGFPGETRAERLKRLKHGVASASAARSATIPADATTAQEAVSCRNTAANASTAGSNKETSSSQPKSTAHGPGSVENASSTSTS